MSVYKSGSRIFDGMSFAGLVLLASLAGCSGGAGGGDPGGGGGGGGDPGPPDTTAPSVTSMSPGEDTGIVANTGVGTNSKITATLSEAMDPALITATNPANFRLTNGNSSVSGTVTYDAANHIAVFTPSVLLTPNIKYTATIITGIKDLKNNPLTRDFAWCFTTGGGGDSTAPGVTSTLPGNNATGVPLNRKITATFSEEMNSLTLIPANFTVTTGAAQVSGAVTYLGRTAIFTPSSALASNTAYTATITAGALDLAGNAAQANVWSFTTGADADVAAPAVVLPTNPAAAATGVAIGSTINVSFNEAMDPATISTESFTVTVPGATPGAAPVRVIGTVAFDASNNNTATFTRINHEITPVLSHPTPVSNLEPNTIYTATLSTGARDMAGNALASDLVWSFTTAP